MGSWWDAGRQENEKYFEEAAKDPLQKSSTDDTRQSSSHRPVISIRSSHRAQPSGSIGRVYFNISAVLEVSRIRRRPHQAT